MGLYAFFIVLLSVFLHAGWNFLSKKCRPSGAFYLLSSLTASLLWMPFVIFGGVDLGALPLKFWLLLGGSGVFEVAYLIGLAYAYRKTDISLAYPLARAIPVLLVAAVTVGMGIGVRPGYIALAGMGVVSCGCFLMPLNSFREIRLSSYFNKAVFFILLAAAGTTGYTVVDSEAIKLLQKVSDSSAMLQSITFLGMVETLIVIGMGGFVLTQPMERAEFGKLFLKSVYPLITGLASSSAYVLILIAMGMVSNVCYIQAFRQMSLPLGVLAGVFILRERCGAPKLCGITLVVVGLIAVAIFK